jgi:ribosome-associated protein
VYNMEKNVFEFLNDIAQAIFDKKGMNILALDVRGLSTMTDFYIIAEGTVDRHVKALCKTVIDAAKLAGYPVWHVEGEQTADWIVIDFGEVMVHLFIPDLREKYALESLWKESTIVDVKITTSPIKSTTSHQHH